MRPRSSILVDFYLGEGRVAPYSFRRLLDENDEFWEDAHDFIQWLFPLRVASAFNPDAPLLTDQDVAEWKSLNSLRVKMQWAFTRFLKFLGLEEKEGKVVPAANFDQRHAECWSTMNHNYLRITRVLASLSILGLNDVANRFHTGLLNLINEKRAAVSPTTERFWQEALTKT